MCKGNGVPGNRTTSSGNSGRRLTQRLQEFLDCTPPWWDAEFGRRVCPGEPCESAALLCASRIFTAKAAELPPRSQSKPGKLKDELQPDQCFGKGRCDH